MSTVAQVFVAIAGVLHLAIFVMESLLISRPQVWRRFLITSQADADTVRPWAVNQGFYNLFLALGALGGLAFFGDRGHTVSVFACACMAAAGLVLLATDRRMLRAAALQALPPVAALLLAAF